MGSVEQSTENPEIQNVGDILAGRKHLFFHPEQFIKLILKTMQKNNAGCATVIDDNGTMIGMLTEREILRTIFALVADPTLHQANLGKYIDDMMVRDVMIPDPKTLTDDTDIETALEIMTGLGFRFMPVIDGDNGHVAGLIDERELAIHVKNRLDRIKQEAKEKDFLLKGLLSEPYGAVAI